MATPTISIPSTAVIDGVDISTCTDDFKLNELVCPSARLLARLFLSISINFHSLVSSQALGLNKSHNSVLSLLGQNGKCFKAIFKLA